MALPKVVVTHWVHLEVLDYLKTFSLPITNQTQNTLPRTEIMARCRDAAAIMAFMPDQFDAAFLQACPHLRIIAGALKGYDNFDMEACSTSGIWFSIVPELLTEPTAELTVGLMLNLARHIGDGDRYIRSGHFDGWKPIFYGKGLSESTVGLVGMGAIGQAIARRLQGFNCRLTYFDQTPLDANMEAELKITQVSLIPLLASSDFVVVVLPLTQSTFHLIDADSLRLMKPDSFLVNTGRGSVVDEAAVCQALIRNEIAGYAADVFEFEDWALRSKPAAISSDLLKDNLRTVFTPHLGSAVDQVRKNIAMVAAQNIKQALSSQRPMHAINQPLT